MNSVIDKIHCSVSLQSIILIVYCIKFILILMKFLKPSDKIIVYVIIGYDSFFKGNILQVTTVWLDCILEYSIIEEVMNLNENKRYIRFRRGTWQV